MEKRSLILIMSFCLLQFVTHAQQNIIAGGANISGTNGNLSYSIGQMSCGSNSNTSNSIIEGLQQPFEISILSGIKNLNDHSLSWSISIYPNPTSDILNLKINNSNLLSDLSLLYYLYDINGKILEENKIIELTTKINVKALQSSTYFLKIFQNKVELIEYKIIKK